MHVQNRTDCLQTAPLSFDERFQDLQVLRRNYTPAYRYLVESIPRSFRRRLTVVLVKDQIRDPVGEVFARVGVRVEGRGSAGLPGKRAIGGDHRRALGQ